MQQVYRGDRADVARLQQVLQASGLPVQLEQYGATTYIVVNSARPDIPTLARTAGRSIRRVPSLDELANS